MQLLWRRRERAKQSTEKEREEEMKGATVEAGAEVKREGECLELVCIFSARLQRGDKHRST